MGCIVCELKSSNNYEVKTEEDYRLALSLASAGLITLSFGGEGASCLKIKNKFIPVYICSATYKLKMIFRKYLI